MKSRTWIEINQANFAHNIAQYKKIIGNGNLSVVIKANAYGHGLTLLGQLAQENRNIHSLCIATIDEALALRSAGITKPIIMPSVLEGDPRDVINQNVQLTVYDYQTLCLLNQIGEAHNFIFPVHIKIDTGLSRLGILPDKAVSFVQKAQNLNNIKVVGLYSHCAESQKEDQSFTLQQKRIFEAVVEEVKKNCASIQYIHFANSSATANLDLPFCNLFRIGVGAFGLWPSPASKAKTLELHPWFSLKPILTWKTTIRHIRHVQAGSFIGYDRTFQAKKDMRIAILPIGYYDGYDFRLFNSGSVLLHGQYAPIIGRVSMNMCSIDVTHIPEAKIDDELILMGPHERVHPYQLGLLIGNPNVREITTKINPEIQRALIPLKEMIVEEALAKNINDSLINTP